ncbi:hydrolase [Shewanella salipaludis]|uniref:Hydrolase n=1 Tax=Shewanella salipaludis TaxID=2723052 RepID=A0A972FZA9_9GAMM|nr:hydrolase [Shewanella salipaludis]NMH65432.1 hydrolase [Shewanella salipaludis]
MLKPEEVVLMIVDVQGKLAQCMDQTERLHQQLSCLILGAQLFDIPVIWLEQLPAKLGPTSPELQTLLSQSSTPLHKQHFSGWQCHEARAALTGLGRKQVLLAGIETHVCVYQTCRDLLDHGYGVHLLADAVSSRELEYKQLGIQMMTQRGALLTNVESLLFELQTEAQGDRFKELLKLIK